MKIQVKGLAEAKAQLEKIQRGVERMHRTKGIVYSRIPWAYGIEYGYHEKSGRLARRAGGARYIRDAREEVLRAGDADLTEGMKKIPSGPGPWVIYRLARWARRLARRNAPRVTGRLRRSLRFDARGPQR